MKKTANDYWKTIKSSQLSHSDTIGIKSLRDNISNYLKFHRNIECNSDQIIITTGSLHSLSLISDSLLIDKDDEIVLENPTYPYAYILFNSLRVNILTASIDYEGIVFNNLKNQN